MEQLVSIITPVYNSEEFLKETIESVLRQSYENWELILVDDCSTDSSRKIISDYANKDRRIKPVFLKKNSGAGFSRNSGIDNAKGDLIAFLDSDDLWHQDKLKEQLHFMKIKNVNMVYTWYYNVNEKGQKISYSKTPKQISFILLMFNNYILTSSLIFKKSILNDIRFSEIRKRQDWVFFLDILKSGVKAYSLDKCLVYYRKSNTSLSANKFRLIKSNLSVIANYFYNGNHLKSSMHFMIFLLFYFHNKTLYKKLILN